MRAPPAGLRPLAPAPDGALDLDVDETVLLRCAASATIDDDEGNTAQSEPEGELFITTARVAFLTRERGFACDYRSLALHAVSREDARFPGGGCVYCQIDGAGEGGAYDEDDPRTAHAYFVPSEGASVEEVYGAMSEGAMLNPDSEEEGEDEAYYEGEEDEDEDEAREAALRRLDDLVVVEDEVEALMRNDPGRFEDLEE